MKNVRKRTSLSAVLLLLLSVSVQGARVDTTWVDSPSMKKKVEVIYVVPDKALGENPQACPVVYLLHGYGGNAGTWIGIKPELGKIADEKGLIFACPDGENSWYWDSPKHEDVRYETFISSELIKYTDVHYATRADRKGRAITGLSMGGHGAMWNALRHKDVFGAAGSTSGGVDIRPFPKNWEMAVQLGDYESNKALWNAHTVVNQLDSIANGDLALIIDCGEKDFFLEVNKDLHKRLLERGIDHDFITRPGVHDGRYWNNSIDYQILFFEKYFKR